MGLLEALIFAGGAAVESEEFSVPVPATASMLAMLEQLGIEDDCITETIVLEAYKRCITQACFVHESPRDLVRAKVKFEKAYDFLLDYIYRACVESIDVVGRYCPTCKREECERKFTHQELVNKLDEALVKKKEEYAEFPDRLVFLDRAEKFLKNKLVPKNSPLRC